MHFRATPHLHTKNSGSFLLSPFVGNSQPEYRGEGSMECRIGGRVIAWGAARDAHGLSPVFLSSRAMAAVAAFTSHGASAEVSE